MSLFDLAARVDTWADGHVPPPGMIVMITGALAAIYAVHLVIKGFEP